MILVLQRSLAIFTPGHFDCSYAFAMMALTLVCGMHAELWAQLDKPDGELWGRDRFLLGL
jgi:hypothetical protein